MGSDFVYTDLYVFMHQMYLSLSALGELALALYEVSTLSKAYLLQGPASLAHDQAESCTSVMAESCAVNEQGHLV